ncbi:hypothetical protein AMATHDRAFT_4757 [Amanita thiersii Skay4041]|uniref:Crinkler effector protein N-terminal domain-containing protein n=1 Tax=Amanita thiersii Skay4041 TaxID=703135 RepID=A0A2A9NPK1_9AGAR|nr:hypothetical protein AMATHDRAFT_4757 [Amanita thiersii Skay4041]
MSTDVELTCYIDGAPIDQLFPISVNLNARVADLKKSIRSEKSNAFMRVDAPELVIWKLVGQVSIDEALNENVNPSTAERKKLLNPMARLSTFFPEQPDPIYLHLVIAPPPPRRHLSTLNPTLTCHFLGQNPDQDIFSIKIEWLMNVNALKEAIKNARSELNAVSACDLTLWKCCIPIPSGSVLDYAMPRAEDALCSSTRLKDIFPMPPKKQHIHLDYPAWSIEFLAIHSCLEDLRANLPTSARASELTSSIQDNVLMKDRMACHRPQTIPAIPVTLLDHVFAKLEDDMQRLSPTREDYAFSRELSDEMSQFYTEEETRVSSLQYLFEKYGLRIHHQNEESRAIMPAADCRNHSLKLLLTGMQSDSGMSHDSFFQVLLYYVKNLIDTYDTAPHLCDTPLPSILLFCNGAFLGVAGALFTARVQRELMGPVLPLFWNESSDAFCHQLARTLGTDGENYSFTYDEHQPLDFHRIFVAQAADRKICVKFTRRYSQEAHRFWAERKRAPDLIAVNSLPAGWIMVVMEYLEDYDYWKAPPKYVWDGLVGLVAEFQEHGFVHGDIRGANILIGQEEGSNELVFKLIDFDWAGKVGTTHYPSRLHPAIARASDVVACGAIEFDHDNYMVNRLSYSTDS